MSLCLDPLLYWKTIIVIIKAALIKLKKRNQSSWILPLFVNAAAEGGDVEAPVVPTLPPE